MKRIITITLIMCCLLLTACNNASVGVIGGADGPTKILVGKGNNKANTETEPIKMVNVKGELYFELDKESEIVGRCGVMDGNFTKTAETFEIPKNDGEANFSGAKGYQIGAENTIEIPLGDDWEIFKKLVTNTDVLKYKYCYTVEGTLPNAQDDSKFLVLANVMDITFEEASYQVLGSDASKMKDIYVCPIAD